VTRTELRSDLPPLPNRMKHLPIDRRGYPVPWFVQWIDEAGDGCPMGNGTPEFRVMDHDHLVEAALRQRCWVCGGTLGRYQTFVAGPMCVVNRTSAEPPSHLDCATFSAIACPFLSRPKAKRREAGMPETGEVPGIMIARNPGVTAVYTTTRYTHFRDPNGGLLFDIGEPDHVEWYAKGRAATRDEIMESITTGLPALRDVAVAEGNGAEAALAACVTRTMLLLPA